jgi:hypothetical protein
MTGDAGAAGDPSGEHRPIVVVAGIVLHRCILLTPNVALAAPVPRLWAPRVVVPVHKNHLFLFQSLLLVLLVLLQTLDHCGEAAHLSGESHQRRGLRIVASHNVRPIIIFLNEMGCVMIFGGLLFDAFLLNRRAVFSRTVDRSVDRRKRSAG